MEWKSNDQLKLNKDRNRLTLVNQKNDKQKSFERHERKQN